MKNSVKNSLSKLQIEGEVQDDATVIENEVLTFFNALFNGYHDSNLVNTGMPFRPDYTHLGKFLDPLTKLQVMPDQVRLLYVIVLKLLGSDLERIVL